jgi:hypothetical protein
VDELLSKGLGTFQEWSAKKEDKEKFAKLSHYARERKLGIFQSEEISKSLVINKPTGEITGKVVNVLSGSRIIVRLENGKEETAFFGSIVAPKISKEKEDPLGKLILFFIFYLFYYF